MITLQLLKAVADGKMVPSIHFLFTGGSLFWDLTDSSSSLLLLDIQYNK